MNRSAIAGSIDMLITALSLAQRLGVNTQEVKQAFDQAEANDTEVTPQQRAEFAAQARQAIDWL